MGVCHVGHSEAVQVDDERRQEEDPGGDQALPIENSNHRDDNRDERRDNVDPKGQAVRDRGNLQHAWIRHVCSCADATRDAVHMHDELDGHPQAHDLCDDSNAVA
eukprot:CAMPEP_0119417228 /NCGR_PEP_ID=MMETSP1335-20130426/15235_1 /TAXON_ID=259385 /ORGANISM="Chrysoculter rhomboideus, Strain RCC1486" /LENGTH=104 /DNA_ID=CAMNT_0007442395 /DNA_START=333 /DNA_END=647 /DNA_ORIENTATION=-